MERIVTEIIPVKVEIDGAEYDVAPRTVSVEEALLDVQQRCAGKPAYRLWTAELEILLGRNAVKKLFRDGRKENIDRLQQIHAGVCRAFERCGSEIERQQAAERAAVWAEAAETLAPVNELLRQLTRADGRTVHREDVRKEGSEWRTE